MGRGRVEDGLVVAMLPRVGAVLVERASRPRLARVEPIVPRVEPDEVHGELSSYDQLLEEGVTVGGGRVGILHRASHHARTEVPEVQERRELAGPVPLGAIAVHRVALEPALDEGPERRAAHGRPPATPDRLGLLRDGEPRGDLPRRTDSQKAARSSPGHPCLGRARK